jgi:hypothetical protein
MKYTDAVLVAMSKLMRKGQTYINARDEAALNDFSLHMGDYLAINMVLAEKVRRYYKEHRLTLKDAEEWDILYDEINNVTTEMLEEANVSLRAYEQMKMLMKIDRNILNEFGKRHTK